MPHDNAALMREGNEWALIVEEAMAMLSNPDAFAQPVRQNYAERLATLATRLRAAADALAAGGEAFTEDEACELCGERRATVHLEGAVNELCVECYVTRLERIASGPVGEMRRLLASFVQRLGERCRLDADGYCQSHFLERGDQCTVKLAREVFTTDAARRAEEPRHD